MARWAAQARRGDEGAFTELVQVYADRLYRFLRGRGVGLHDAEDLVQDTFVRAWQNIERYNPAYAFSTWIFTIGARLAISHHRRRREVNQEVGEEVDAGQAQPGTAVAEAEERDRIWEAARQFLSAPQFEVLWLHYAEDLPVREIARITSRTEVHVKVLLHRARNRLRGHLAQEKGEDA